MPAAAEIHKWNVTYHEAVAIQNELKKKIRFVPLKRDIRTVAGADVSYDKRNDRIYAAVVILSFPSLDTLEEVVVEGKSVFPYIPGLLSFREAPIVVRAYEKLRLEPDILVCDGQGVAHPRRLGLASHLGLLLGISSIGCAKSRLWGEHDPVGPHVGDYAPLKAAGRTIGAVLRTRKGVKPVYVSVGHLINLRRAMNIILACGAGYRIPEPTRRAHQIVTLAKSRKRHSIPELDVERR